VNSISRDVHSLKQRTDSFGSIDRIGEDHNRFVFKNLTEMNKVQKFVLSKCLYSQDLKLFGENQLLFGEVDYFHLEVKFEFLSDFFDFRVEFGLLVLLLSFLHFLSVFLIHHSGSPETLAHCGRYHKGPSFVLSSSHHIDLFGAETI
jgi:hypothetical protein